MQSKICNWIFLAKAATPYMWGFAAAAAMDRVIDIQTVFLPVLALALVVSAGALSIRRWTGQ